MPYCPRLALACHLSGGRAQRCRLQTAAVKGLPFPCPHPIRLDSGRLPTALTQPRSPHPFNPPRPPVYDVSERWCESQLSAPAGSPPNRVRQVRCELRVHAPAVSDPTARAVHGPGAKAAGLHAPHPPRTRSREAQPPPRREHPPHMLLPMTGRCSILRTPVMPATPFRCACAGAFCRAGQGRAERDCPGVSPDL